MKLLTFAALAMFAAPGLAQTATPLPKCSATVTDSCDQGANNPRAMTAAQAEASGGVGDRVAVKPMPAKKKMVHRKKTVTTVTTTAATSQ